MELTKYIPLKDIKKIEIYENTRYLTVTQIAQEKHCDFAITGLFYNSNWEPTCHLKKDSRVLASNSDIYRGCAWNDGKDIVSCRVPIESKNKKNHYACCALIANGRPYPDDLINYNKDVGGRRGRTGIGVSKDNLILYVSTDGYDATTPEQLRDRLYGRDKNIQWFIMGDGGGKVNYCEKGRSVVGRAKSQNLLLVYLNDNKIPNKIEEVPDNGIGIIPAFLTKNPRYYNPSNREKFGYMQHSTAMPGVKAKSIINNWNSSCAQAETEFIIDDTGIYQMMPLGIKTWHCGGSANNTHAGCEICEPEQARFIDVNWYTLNKGGKNNTKYAVLALQKELTAWGYNVNGIDGIFGNGTYNAVKDFQRDNNLTSDGIVGKGTLHKLQTRNGSYLKYNIKENQPYFEDVYRKAVFTCGYVLNKFGTKNYNKPNIVSHSEGYKLGIASNHADVEHWWIYHDKSMDDFRKDVKIYLDTGILPYTKEEVKPEVSNPITPPKTDIDLAWEKACKLKIFDGSNPTGNVTRRQLAVVLDRLNLLN